MYVLPSPFSGTFLKKKKKKHFLFSYIYIFTFLRRTSIKVPHFKNFKQRITTSIKMQGDSYPREVFFSVLTDSSINIFGDHARDMN
jgi:hypothetical protein